METLSDKDAILKIKNGEIDYFSLLVDRYTAMIFNFVIFKLKNKEDAEDLVQNVFISFYKAIERFDVGKPVKPYLFQIVSNELKMFYRSKKSSLPLKEEIYLVADDKGQDVSDNEDYLRFITDKEKQMLLMLGEGYSYVEVAVKFKKPLNTIKSIVRRARLKLNKRRRYEK